MARRVHGERAVGLMYGQRALLIGALEPLTYTGTMLSTKARDWPFKRLTRTAKAQEAIFLGSREEADRILARVANQHRRVKGALEEDAGAHSAGTEYSAFDPELMLWTLAVIADSGRAIYETMVRALSPEEREGLWQDYLRFGELFGMPCSVAPGTYPEFVEWFGEKLASSDLHATPHALAFAPLVAFEQPLPRRARLNLATVNHLIKGTLPPRVREVFGIEWGPRQERSFQALAATHRAAHHALPRKVRRGRNDAFFDVVATGERLRGGTPTPGLGVGVR